jgi:DNA processing protein
MDNNLLKYKIGISMIPGIGCITAKKLIAYTGSIEGVFKEKRKSLLKIPGIGKVLADEIINNTVLHDAEKEIEFIEKYKITPLFYLDPEYPERLKRCSDSPVMLYIKGTVNLNHQKILSIVGTRSATHYGKNICEKLVSKLAEAGHDPIIVSGLAYGIDVCAHKAALKNNLLTIAVLGHGLKSIYPSLHANIAREISKHGALVTEFTSEVIADRPNFVKRNRIIAGLSDATIVVESGEEGGALITADIANSYNRDVFAVPGRTDDKVSKGCNKLIKTNKASLIENVEDLEYLLGWETQQKNKVIQKELFVKLDIDEQKILDIIQQNGEIPIDSICFKSDMPVSKVSPLLLNLEFAGIVKSLPGKVYKPA